MNAIQLRHARREDMEKIHDIETKSFDNPYPRPLLEHLIRDNPRTFLVAEFQPESIVGYCVAAERRGWAHLISVAVLEEYRRRGVGTKLIRGIITNLDPQTKEVRLEVNERNSDALNLYEHLGFRRVEVIDGYYMDGSPAVKMRFTLTHS